MILTCENCKARYLVAPHVLGEAGRRVRCTACGQEWFQKNEEKPEDEPVDFKTMLESVEPIPESVRPVPEEPAPKPKPAPKKKERGPRTGKTAGYMAAAMVVLSVLGGEIALRAPIALAWPPAAGLYLPLGLDVPVNGEGLAFDHVTAGWAGKSIKIEGRIINMKESDIVLPPLEVLALGEGEKILAAHVADAGGKSLKGQGEQPLSATYPDPPEGTQNVMIRFALQMHRKAAEPAHEEAGQEHAEPRHEESSHEADHGHEERGAAGH